MRQDVPGSRAWCRLCDSSKRPEPSQFLFRNLKFPEKKTLVSSELGKSVSLSGVLRERGPRASRFSLVVPVDLKKLGVHQIGPTQLPARFNDGSNLLLFEDAARGVPWKRV